MFPALKIQIIRVFKYLTPRNSSVNDYDAMLPALPFSIVSARPFHDHDEKGARV
jgi:septin family protein